MDKTSVPEPARSLLASLLDQFEADDLHTWLAMASVERESSRTNSIQLSQPTDTAKEML
jgi:hypothetical protein